MKNNEIIGIIVTYWDNDASRYVCRPEKTNFVNRLKAVKTAYYDPAEIFMSENAVYAVTENETSVLFREKNADEKKINSEKEKVKKLHLDSKNRFRNEPLCFGAVPDVIYVKTAKPHAEADEYVSSEIITDFYKSHYTTVPSYPNAPKPHKASEVSIGHGFKARDMEGNKQLYYYFYPIFLNGKWDSVMDVFMIDEEMWEYFGEKHSAVMHSVNMIKK